ncbi:MAG: hypothetical protein EAZ42_01895 [Verrucomicrobia bacterium]|nr:MAG: hypothetical protein EAZ42_01895 [Verrucomicrobiota bacterium]
MKWWIYQKERFSLVAHAPLILAFSACGVSYSALLVGTRPSLVSFAVAFAVCLMMFMQLRIADEFKDAEDDARWRPYRPVPRGLVSLAELRGWFIAFAIAQLALSALLDLWLIGLLLVAWSYLTMMCVEFFCRDWLKARPVIYLLSHMGIMPLVDWFATACHWAPAGHGMPAGLGWFLAASFFNGIVIELGRKIRRKEDEEEGVETYSVLWGKKRATIAWLATMLLTLLCGWRASLLTNFHEIFLWCTIPAFLLSACVAYLFIISNKSSKGIEKLSALWTLALYLILGVIPLWLKY